MQAEEVAVERLTGPVAEFGLYNPVPLKKDFFLFEEYIKFERRAV